MTYVITDRCAGEKSGDCLEVCPVDCIHPTLDDPDYEQAPQLYIDPRECIDCTACSSACPVDACVAERDLSADALAQKERNAEFFRARRARTGR